MDLTDRYFASVRLLLPFQGRDDIVAELRDELASRREEREADLGRPLARGEEEDLLRAFGNPITVAGRYGPLQTVVGPELFPLYRLVTLMLMGITFAGGLIGLGVSLWAPGHVAPIAAAIHAMIDGPIWVVGFTTIGFAILDRTPWRANILRVLNDWDPRELPQFPQAQRRSRRLQGWPHHVAGIVAQLVFIACWVGFIPLWRFDIPIDSGGAIHVGFDPALATLYWPVLGLAFGAIVVEIARLMGRRHRIMAGILSVVLHIAVIVVAGLALSMGPFATVTPLDGVPPSVAAAASHGVNLGLHIAAIVVIVVSALAAVLDVWRMVRPDEAASA
jgi:hypothetical protein